MAIAQRRYPLAPLYEAVGGPASMVARCIDTSTRTVLRWAAEGGITERSADRAACRLGLHMQLLWPAEYAGIVDRAEDEMTDST